MIGETRPEEAVTGSEKTLAAMSTGGSAGAEGVGPVDPFLTIRRAGINISLAGRGGRPAVVVAVWGLEAMAAAEGLADDWASGIEAAFESGTPEEADW